MSKFKMYSFEQDSSYVKCLKDLRNREVPKAYFNTQKEEDYLQLLREVIRVIERNQKESTALFKFYTQK